MKSSLPVPAFDDEFYRYPDFVQDEINTLMDICARIQSSPLGVVKAAGEEARRFFGQRGRSAKRLIAKYYDFINSGGDWHVFVNRAKFQTDSSDLPEEFLNYWRALCESNKRKCRPGYRRLLSIWRSGEPVPGYGTWREYWTARGMIISENDLCPPDLPSGWSYGNLMRYRPDDADLTLARQGISATMSMLPTVIGTRAGLRPLEWIVFDDWESDFLVSVPGVDRPCKLKGLICKDVATDMWLRFALRPSVPRDDGTEDGLKLRDMKRLAYELLSHFGHPVDYVSHWVIERGTATFPAGDARALNELSGGMIVVHETQMISGQVLLGGFADKSVGNPRGKSWIESGFNLLHNEAGFVPGQKGRRYDLAPAELEARKKYAVALVSAGKALPPALRAQLRLPFQNIYEAVETWRNILLNIGGHTDHRCEGFDEIALWRLSEGDQWRPWSQLIELPAEMMDRVLVQRRLETRVERWHRLIQGVTLQKMSEAVAPRWLDGHKEVTVDNYQIEFRHEGKDYKFYHHDSPLLVNGRKYLAYFHPIDVDAVYLTDGAGAYKGMVPRVKAVSKTDLEARRERSDQVRSLLRTKLGDYNARHAAESEQSIADAEHNLEVFKDGEAIQVSPDVPAVRADDPSAAVALSEAIARRAAEDAHYHDVSKVDVVAVINRKARRKKNDE